MKAPTSAELTQLSQTIARRVGRFLERQGVLERDAENRYLATDALEAGPMDQLRGYWFGVGYSGMGERHSGYC